MAFSCLVDIAENAAIFIDVILVQAAHRTSAAERILNCGFVVCTLLVGVAAMGLVRVVQKGQLALLI